jgi:hypothetical protein
MGLLRLTDAQQTAPSPKANEYRHADSERWAAGLSFVLCRVVRLHGRGTVGSGVSYCAFTDPAAGGVDSFTLAIAHYDAKAERAVLDLVRERQGGKPEETAKEFAGVIRSYGLAEVSGDNYAKDWVANAFEKAGVRYSASEKTRSELYLEVWPRMNSGVMELLDHPKMVSQFADLQRSAKASWRDAVDHPVGGHNDISNSVAGALVRAIEAAGLDIGPMLAMMQREAMKSIQPVWAAQREAMCRADAEAACPHCGAGANLVHRVADGARRCNQCGHQWDAPKIEFPAIARRRF